MRFGYASLFSTVGVGGMRLDLAGAMQDAMQGVFSPWQYQQELPVYTIVFGYLAVRNFQWE